MSEKYSRLDRNMQPGFEFVGGKRNMEIKAGDRREGEARGSYGRSNGRSNAMAGAMAGAMVGMCRMGAMAGAKPGAIPRQELWQEQS